MDLPWLIYLLVCVLGAYPALILATIVHEIGHAVFARLAGYRVTSLGLGVGSPLMILRLPGNILFYICRQNPLFGTCWTTTTETFLPFPRYTLRLLGGVIANLLVMALLFSMRSLPLGWIWVALGLFNGFLAAINLLPFRVRLSQDGSPISSDGMKVLSAYFSRHHSHAGDPLQQLEFRAMWEAVGDTRAHRYHLYLAAMDAFSLENTDWARQFLEQAERLPADESDTHLFLIRTLLTDEPETRKKRLQEVAREYALLGSHSGEFSANMYRLSDVDFEEEAAITEKLKRSPLYRRPEIERHRASYTLTRFLSDTETYGDFATVETLIARYEASRRRSQSEVQDAIIYGNIAAWRKFSGDEPGSTIAWEKAQHFMREVERSLSSTPALVDWYRQYMNDISVVHTLPLPFPKKRRKRTAAAV